MNDLRDGEKFDISRDDINIIFRFSRGRKRNLWKEKGNFFERKVTNKDTEMEIRKQR